MSDILILIPPSEGKTSGGEGSPLETVPLPAAGMIDRLLKVRQDQWPSLLGVKERALEQAVAANQNVLTAPTRPAIDRYSGVVYKAIDYPTLSQEGKEFCNQHVRIVSALFGLLRPQDPVPEYKLKIDKLQADRYWRDVLTPVLEDAFVLDLLPQTHKKAVPYRRGVSIDFCVLKQGKKIAAGHQGKHIKGRFVRWLCRKRNLRESGWQDFQEEGFSWNGICFLKSS